MTKRFLMTGKRRNPYLAVGLECVLYHAYWDGTAVDHSAQKNDGTLAGSPVFDSGIGLIFDGTNDAVTCGTTGILTMTAYEVEMWMKAAVGTTGNYRGVFTMNDTYPGRGGEFSFPSGSLSCTYQGYQDDTTQEVIQPTTNWGAVENVWFHSNISVKGLLSTDWPSGSTDPGLWFNNIACELGTPVHTHDHAVISKFYIGNNSYCGTFFKGTIGEIRIYNRVRTSDERTASFNATKARYGL